MAGHKSGAVENAYYKPHQKALMKFYVNECLPLIQFKETEAIRLVDEDFLRLQALERENAEMKAELGAVKQGIDDLKSVIATSRSQSSEIVELLQNYQKSAAMTSSAMS
ncbi:MAG: hypothetical protein R2741_02450 [Methanolobus sp.]